MAKIGVMSFAHMHALSYAACLNELPEAELRAVGMTMRRAGRNRPRRSARRSWRTWTRFSPWTWTG